MLTFSQIIFRLILAIICGGIIGWERELKAKTAGLRTHVLLCLGSSLAMLTSIFLLVNRHYYGADVTRIASGVLQGIGLLCVAAILRYKESVVGLSTSASLWVVAAVGLAVGAGFYSAAILTTIFCLLILSILTTIENRFIRKFWPEKFRIKFFNEPDLLKELLSSIRDSQEVIKIVRFREMRLDKRSILELILESNKEVEKKMIDNLTKIKGIIEVEVLKEEKF